MSSFRKFTRKTQLKKQTAFSLGALSFAAFTGLAFFPTLANAVGIERADGGVIESNGNTHNVYASEVRSTIGVNRFHKFNLEENNIANMYFHTKNNPGAEASNLLNFVADKINVNGTINAIRNNKIGGNLYFLSKEGLVVGKTGVINAGTFNMYTRNETYQTNEALFKDFDQIVNMKEDLNRLNDDGMIEVYGKINTVDGLRLKAGSVIIGGTQSQGLAALKSGVVDFSNLVNIKAGSTEIKSGLTGEQLKATRANNGDIVLGSNYDPKGGFKNGTIQLRAYADTRNAFDKNYNPLATSVSGNNVVRAEVQVNEGSAISAYGDVNITAEASYGKGLSGIFGTDIESANVMDLLGKAAKTEALITVNGNVKAGVDAAADGKGSVSMKANTVNNFASKDLINVSRNLMQQGEDKLLGWLFKGDALPANISYANIEADAIISVGEKADIQALNDVNISTNSKIKSNVGTKKEVDNLYLAQYEEQQKQGTWSQFIDKYAGRAGIAINNTTNVSKIALNGKVKAGEVQNTDGSKAQGKGSINAKAESDAVNLASAKIQNKKGSDPGEQGNGVKVALVYSNMQNTTDITVNGELTAVSGKINLESSGVSSVTTSAEAKSGDGGTYATTAINIDKVNTKSTITVNGKLNAAKGIDIETTNETDMCGDASTEAKWNAETMADIYGEGSRAEYEGLSNMFDGVYRDAEGALPSNYKEMLAAGIAFNWGDFDVSSAINVGAGAEMNVPKDATTVIKDKDGKEKTVPAEINLNATSSITDFSMQAFGSSTKGEKSTDEDTKLISGAVLINNVKNEATINIAGGEGGKAAPVINAPVVNISAEATNDWDRINGMLDYIDVQFKMAMDIFKYNIDILKLLQNCYTKMQAYSKNPSEENLSALYSAIADLKKIATTATYKNFTKLDKNIFDATLTAAWDMLAANNYANTYVTSSATSDADEQAKFALSGAVSVNNFTNKANVIIGSGAQITAAKGDVEISSTSSQNMVHLAGPLYEFDTKDALPKGESAATKYLHDHLPSLSLFPTMWAGNDAKNLIGGNIIVTNNHSQALTVIGAGAQISGNSVSLGADNFLANSNIILAGGSAGSIGITGMGSYDSGSSNSIISVSNGAQIMADGEGEDEGNLEIAANNKNIITSIVGNLSTSDSKAAGASLGVVNYDINTISSVANNAKSSLAQDDKLHKILNASLNDVQKNYLGTSSKKGLLKAAQNVAITAKDTGVINTITVAGVSAGGGDDKDGQQGVEADSFLDKLDVAAAGSVSVNTITGTTLAGADGADITVADGDASVKAEESKYVGAYSGAAALKMLNVPASDNAAATLAGSVGVNKGRQEVSASLKNSTVAAKNIDNRAVKQGTNVAVGLAYGQTKVKTGSLGAQFVGSGSGISLKNTVNASMDNVTIADEEAVVKNIAQNKDVQVAGGVSASYAKDAKLGIGASVAYLDTTNTVNASISNSTITAKSLESLAVSKTTQVAGAVTAGVMTGEGVKVGVNGAVVNNTLTNTNTASITGSTITTDELRVRAYDGNLTELDKNDTEKEVTDTSENASLKVLKEQGFNVDAVESTLGDKVEISGTGNRIISAALGVNADISTDKATAANVGAGVAVSVNKIKNSFSAGVDNSTIINKNTASIDAKSNASLLNVSAVAGVTVSGGTGTSISGGGNVAVNNVQTDVKAALDNASVTTGALAVTAQDAKKIQNYAGTLNFTYGDGASATMGASVGVNNLSGNTIAQVDNSTLNLNAANANALIAANSSNDIKNVIITAGAGASGSGIALSGAGTVAASNVSGATKAGMTNSDFNKDKTDAANDLSITADDTTNVTSVVGNGTVSLAGGSFAAQLGAGADKISFARSATAELIGDESKKNTINAGTLSVKANSTQELNSYVVGVGGAVSGTAAGSLNGAVSTEKNTTLTSSSVENITGKVDNIDVDAQHINKLNRFNLGAALSGGQYSASAGFSIGVLNDASETRANFKNNKLITTGDININAANDTTLKSNVNTAAVAVAIGAGVGANIVVDDFTNKVNVDVSGNEIGDADHVANSFNATDSNKLTDTSEQGTATGALVTGSVGVGVFTTNTSVTNNLDKNTIYAHNISATANEQRNFDNKIINGSIAPVGISISALINNVGAAVDDKISYVIGNDGTKDTQTATADIAGVLNLLDKALVEQDNYITDKGTLGALSNAGLTEKDTQNNVKVSRGTAAGEGVQVLAANNKLYSDNKVNLTAHETTNMQESNKQGGINGVGINIAVSKAKVNNKVGVSVTDTTLDAITKTVKEKDKDGKEVTRTIISARPDVAIASTVDGEISNNAWQGGISGVAINTVYAGTWINNENSVGISKSNIISSKMNILAQDALHNTVNSFGTSNGLLTGGALYATAQSKSNNLINIDASELYAGMDAKNNIFNTDGELLIKAEKSNKVKAKVTAGAVAAVSGKGMVATAIDGEGNDIDTQGSVSTVNIANSNLKAGKAITATASKLLDVQAVINSWEAGLGGTANGAIAHAYATGAANMVSGDGNSFITGESVTLQSLIDKAEDSEHSLSADMSANNGGVLGVAVNEAKTVYNVLANTQANEAVYKAQNLTIKANHNVDIFNSAQGVEVGLAVASGTMAAHAITNAMTHIDAAGAKYAVTPDAKNAADEDNNASLGLSSDLGDVDISANTLVQENITAKGNGGGLLDVSPVAAKIVNKLTTDTVANVSGNWLLNGNLTVDALNQDKITQTATSTKVGVVGGYGGVQNYDVTKHNAKVNIGSTAKETTIITTDGLQLYQAGNIVNHRGSNDASGGGILDGSASDLATKYNNETTKFTSSVNFANAQLTTEGVEGSERSYTTDATENSSIKAQAFTEADLSYDNKLNGVGIIYSGVWNKSEHDITYDNSVNVNNSKLTTKDRKQDITLAAYDKSTVNINTVASSGALAASAYGRSYTNLARNAKVNIDNTSALDSAYNTYINAGADLNGISSTFDYTVNTESYNKSLIPAGTSDKMVNNLFQNNQLDIAGAVTTVHNAYLVANGGSSNVKKSSKRYTIYTGTKTNEELTSVEGGEIDDKQTTNNFVNVTGSVVAGTHSGLDLIIAGNLAIGKDAQGHDEFKYNDLKVTVDKDSDWFKAETIKPGEVEVKNALLESYTKIQNAMSGYAEDSAEYKALAAELDTLFKEMTTNGFVVEGTDEKGEKVAVILDSRYMPSIEVPDIYVSGGNIHITADDLKGDGKLEAKGVNNLNITNNSNTNMIIHDVVIEEAGGRVTFNGKNADANNRGHFTGEIKTVTGTAEPAITIKSTGNADETIKKYTNADITILGKLQNLEGKIDINNTQRNINIAGDAAISAQTIAINAGGSVTQNSTGFTSVGSDPIARYQFNEEIAKKIQQYIAYLIKNGKADEFKADSYEDYCDYLLKHASEMNLSAVEQETIRTAKANYIKMKNGEIDNGIVAGSNVYINARNLNIDGLVQSGYDNYHVEYTDGMKERINELDKKYASIANKDALTDSDVLGNSEFLINYTDGKASGGATYDSTGKKYTYEIKLYYNPSTKEIVSERIKTNGGKIYLIGAISSTGNGRLLAMNGMADVSLDLSKATDANQRDLNVSDIKINDVAGLISIRDTAQSKQTTYKVAGDKVERTTYDKGNIGDAKTELVDKAGLVYNPKAGTTISWTGGTNGGQTVTTKGYDKTFVGWGLIKWGKTEEFIDKIKGDSGKITSTTTTTTDGSTLANGVLISADGTNYGFSINGKAYGASKYYGPVSYENEYNGIAGKIFGYGKTHYTWKEYEGGSTSSTSTIKADSAIGVGFMEGGKGTISVKNSGNVNVAGWLRNAEKAAKNSDGTTTATGIGSIELASTSGSVFAFDGARLLTDNLSASAYDDIYVYDHNAIGDNAKINLNAQTGNIIFKSDKGNVQLAGAGAANGWYVLDAVGDITTAKNADGTYTNDKIIGKYIGLTSKGKVDVRVDAGTDMGEWFDNGLTIEAEGDIKVYHNENNKDLLIGEIISNNGDVYIETNNSFVDANNDNTLSDADDKVKHWQEMGIISAKDDAASKTASAKEDKDAALADANAKLAFLARGEKDTNAKVAEYQDAAQGLQEAFNTYRTALKNAKTDEERATAMQAYASEKANYFAKLGKAYSTDEQSAIANYAEANFTDNYGWSANDLIYAIQKDVLNSAPGQTVLGDVANITGHKITLKAGSGIGVDAPAETIKAGTLTQLENLKKLAQAKSGDLTWHDDGSVTIRKQQPLLLNVLDKTDADGKVTKGSVDLDATNNVYIAGIKDTQLNINGSIDTTGDIKLMADKGITASDKATLSGRNLTLYGGAGDVGSADSLLNISHITGSLNANTDKEHGVYIQKTKDGAGSDTKLTIEAITTGNLVLKSATGIDWTKETGKTNGYIDAASISLTATDGTDIGEANSALRILNNDAVINASGSSIYLQGVNEAGKMGSLTAQDLFVDNELVFNSEGNIKLAGGVDDAGNKFVGKIAKRTVDTSGKESYSAAAKVTLNSTGGSITQENDHQILVASLTATAQGDVLLESGAQNADDSKLYNELENVTLGSASGNILLANGGDKDLTITIAKVGEAGLAESIDLHNYKNGNVNSMTVNSAMQAKGDISVTQDEGAEGNTLTINGDVTSNEGNITFEGAQGVAVTEGTLTAGKGNITIWADHGDINNQASIFAVNGTATIAAFDGKIINKGKEIKAAGIGYIAKGDINFNAINKTTFISAGIIDDKWHTGSISLISVDGNVNIWNDAEINADGNVLLQGYKNVSVGSEGTGDLGNVTSKNGDITFVAKTGNVYNKGNVKAEQGKVTLTSEQGTVSNLGDITGKSVTIDAYGNIDTENWVVEGHGVGTITATGTDKDDKLEIISRNGSVTLTDDTTLLAANDIVIDAEKDVINNMNHAASHNGGLYTQNGDIFITSNAGNIVNNNDLLTDKGNIYLRSLAGTIDNNGTIDAGNGAFLNAYGDLNINKDAGVTGKGANGLNFVSSNGSVTFGDGVLVASNADINVLAQNSITNNNNTSGSSAGHTWNGLLAKHNINMTAQNGNIENNAGLMAWDGDVTLSAANGKINNTATTVSAGKDISFTAKNITSGTEAKKANLTAQKGKVELVTTDGDITSFGDIKAATDVILTAQNNVNSTGAVNGKDITFTAEKDVINNGDVTAQGKLIFTAQNGGLLNNGNLTAGADLLLTAKEDAINEKGKLESKTGKISLVSQTANVLSTGSLTAAKDVNILADQSIITDAIDSDSQISGSSINLQAQNGEIINRNKMEAEKDITLAANTDVSSTGALTAKNGSLELNAATGKLSNNGALNAHGDIYLTSADTVTTSGDLTSSTGDITLNSYGDVKVIASNISAKGSFDISSLAGSIDINKDVTAGRIAAKDIIVTAAQNVTNNSTITASGNVDMEAEIGTLTNTGAITAESNITLTAQGVLTNKGALQSKNADIELTTKAGNLTNEGAITAKQNILLNTLATLTNSGELKADADVTLEALGQLSNKAKVTAGKNISFTASGNDGAGTASINNSGDLIAAGDVTLDGFLGVKNTQAITSTNGSVEIISDNNDVVNEGAVSAKYDVTFTAGDKLENSGAVTSSAGSINFTVQDEALTNTGALSAQDDIFLVAEKASIDNKGAIKATEGNVLLDAKTTVANTNTIAAGEVLAIMADSGITNSGALSSKNSDIYVLGGDIENTASVTAENGEILFVGNNITQNNGTLTAGHKDIATGETVLGNVEFIASGTINNSSVINATGDISFEGVSITNNENATLTAGDDVTFAAGGAITNKAEITSDNDVDFTAGGELKNSGTITAADDVHFTAGADIVNSGALNAKDDIIFSAGKNISNTNTSKLTTEGNVSFTAGEKISNKSDIDVDNITMDAGTDIDNDGALLSADADITMTAKGNIENDAEMVSDAGDIKLTAKNITQKQPVTAKFGEVDMTADSTDGTINITNVKGVTDVIKGILGVNLTAGGKITSTSGNINAGFTGQDEDGKPFEYGDVVIRSLHDTIDYAGNITGVNVTLEAAKDITIDGSKNSTIKATGKLKENDALTISSTNGSVTINNDAKLEAANDLIIKAQQNITNNFDSSDAGLTAGKDIMLITKAGDIDNNGKITAANGDVLLKAEQGSIDNDADITGKSVAMDAYKDLHIDASSGHTYKATGTEAGDALSFISRNGDVIIDKDATFDAGKDIIITAKKNVANGMIVSATDRTPGHDLIADNGSISIIAEDGIVYNNAKIRAKENVGVYGGTYIINAGSVEATGTNENEGNIFFQANNDIWQLNGGVKGTDNVILASLVGNITLMDDVTSLNGSVALVANGDIDAVASDIHKLLEIKAKEGAYLISNNGNINADKVAAKDITYAANSDEHTKADGTNVKSTIKVKQTHVGETLDITGNNVFLHETAHPGSGIYDPDDCFTEHGIWQTGDSDTLYLKLSTAKNSAGAYVPAENLVLNFHKINGTLDIDKLWVNNIDLKIPADGLNIHKLAVAGRADISTNKMHSTIYGKAPQRTDADTIFWQDYAHRNPGMSEELWNSWNDDSDNSWMNLFFHRDGVRQTSNNSVLLHKRDYRYVYNQRYSAEDWMLYRTLFDESGHRGDLSIVPLYERYDLLDYEQNADADEAAVKVE